MRVAIFGYYGFGNLGDEAVVSAMVTHLREAIPGVELWVLSADPEGTEAVHGVPAVKRTDWGRVRRLFRGSALVCSGGGSLFQDVTSWRSPLFYGLLHELAQPTPVLVYAQGLGPLRRRASRWVARRAMQRASAITVRDAGSATILRELGVDRPVEVVCDPALDLRAPEARCQQDILVVSVRPWPGVRWDALREALGALVRDGVVCRVLCLHRAVDLELSRELAEALGVELVAPSSPQEALRYLAESRLVVGMRLHALVLAAACGIPFLGLVYDPKVWAFAQSLGMPRLNVEHLEAQHLLGQITSLWIDADLPGRLAASVEAMRPLARKPARLAAELVGATKP